MQFLLPSTKIMSQKKTPTTNSDIPYSFKGALGGDEIDNEDFIKLKGGDLIYVSTYVGWRKVGILDDLYYNVNDGNVYRYYKNGDVYTENDAHSQKFIIRARKE